jgi:hypothetical protein
MGFGGLFLLGLRCTEAKFMLIQFLKHLGVFFSHKKNEWGVGGLEKINKNKLQFVTKKKVANNTNN